MFDPNKPNYGYFPIFDLLNNMVLSRTENDYNLNQALYEIFDINFNDVPIYYVDLNIKIGYNSNKDIKAPIRNNTLYNPISSVIIVAIDENDKDIIDKVNYLCSGPVYLNGSMSYIKFLIITHSIDDKSTIDYFYEIVSCIKDVLSYDFLYSTKSNGSYNLYLHMFPIYVLYKWFRYIKSNILLEENNHIMISIIKEYIFREDRDNFYGFDCQYGISDSELFEDDAKFIFEHFENNKDDFGNHIEDMTRYFIKLKADIIKHHLGIKKEYVDGKREIDSTDTITEI